MKFIIYHRQGAGTKDVAILEREDVYSMLSRQGNLRRISAHPVYPFGGERAYRTPQFVVNNTMRAGGKSWLGYMDDSIGEKWYMAYWDITEKGFDIGPRISPAADDVGSEIKPISVAQHPSEPEQMYIVGDDGVVRLWDGLSLTASTIYNRVQWLRRTTTPDILSLGGVSNWGNGFIGDLLTAEPDLMTWDGTYLTWPTEAEAIANAGNTPGYGHFWAGQLVHIWHTQNRWWGLASGHIFDEGPFPGSTGTPLSQYACNAIWQCAPGGDPTNPDAWERFLFPIIPWNPNTLDGKWNGADKLHASYFYWLSWRDNQPYISADPYPPSTIDNYNQTCVYTINGEGVVEPALLYAAPNCYSGPLVVVGDTVYAIISNANNQTIELWQILDEDVSGALISSTPWSGAPQLGSALASNGAIYISVGQTHSPQGGDVLNFGTGDDTGWDVVRYTLSTNTWAVATRVFPGTGDSAFGILPRFLQTRAPAGGQGGGGDPGGGGGGGGGGGTCGEYAVYQGATVTFDFFDNMLTTYFGGSPILSEGSTLHWWNKLLGKGINPAVALAFWLKESMLGTNPGQVLASSHNIGNIRPHSWGRQVDVVYTECCGAFSVYNTWEDGIDDWTELFELPIYAGKSLEEIVYIYAPPSENETSKYWEQMCGRLIEWQAAG